MDFLYAHVTTRLYYTAPYCAYDIGSLLRMRIFHAKILHTSIREVDDVYCRSRCFRLSWDKKGTGM